MADKKSIQQAKFSNSQGEFPLKRELLICLAGLISLFGPCLASATDFSTLTEYGPTTLSQDISFDGDFLPLRGKDDSDWSWGFDYTYTKITDSSDPSYPIQDESTEVKPGIDWSADSNFHSSIDLDWTTTPIENLTASGIDLEWGYTFKSAGEAPSRLKADLTFSRKNYLEIFESIPIPAAPRNKKPAKVPKPTSGSSSMDQTGLGTSLKFVPNKTWKIGASFTYYFYDHDVGAFLSNLDTTRAVVGGPSGFSDTVSGLALNAATLSIENDFAKSWSWILSENYSVQAADYSLSSVTKLLFRYAFSDDWRTSLGAEYTTSEFTNEFSGVFELEGKF